MYIITVLTGPHILVSFKPCIAHASKRIFYTHISYALTFVIYMYLLLDADHINVTYYISVIYFA